MKRKLILGTVLALVLTTIVVTASFATTLASHDGNSGTVTDKVNYGYALIDLTTMGRPNLRLNVENIQKSPLGPGDRLTIAMFVPGMGYFPVAIIGDNPAAVDLLKTVYLGSAAGQNGIVVAKDVLEVWTEGNTLIVNLTQPVNINIGDPFPQPLKNLNFTLPPFSMTFEGITSPKCESGTLVSLVSQYTIESTARDSRGAFVGFACTAWGFPQPFPFTTTGFYTLHLVNVYTPPA